MRVIELLLLCFADITIPEVEKELRIFQKKRFYKQIIKSKDTAGMLGKLLGTPKTNGLESPFVWCSDLPDAPFG